MMTDCIWDWVGTGRINREVLQAFISADDGRDISYSSPRSFELGCVSGQRTTA